MFEKHVPLAKQIWKVGLPATPRPACLQASTAMRSIPSKPLARATPRTAKEATRKIIFRSTMLRFPTSKRRCDILLAGKIVGAGTCSTRLRSKSGPVSIMWRSTTTDASHHAMLRCRRGTSALSGAQHVGLIDGNEVRGAACGLPTLYSTKQSLTNSVTVTPKASPPLASPGASQFSAFDAVCMLAPA